MDVKAEELETLKKAQHDPGFWSNNEKAQEAITKIKDLKRWVDPWKKLQRDYHTCRDLVTLAIQENDTSLLDEIQRDIEQVEADFTVLELQKMLGGDVDRNSAIISIHAGAGGTESCDWAQMLLRMYRHWIENRGFREELLDMLPGDEAGVKSVTLLVKGEYAYGYLKAERGVHRLVRISPFDANKRRHTSFASVDVIAEVEDEITVQIKEDELRIDTYRSRGAGGQHVNVTDSAVRITHLPTGIVVQCQNERSQHKNRSTAMKLLQARLYEYYKRLQDEKLLKEYGNKPEIAWGSQIRSYVMHPYSMVKDHRTVVETSDVTGVMDGDIDRFIEAYLLQKK